MTLMFTVLGVPQPKGSTQSFGYLAKDPTTGVPRTRTTKTGKLVPVIRTATKSDNPKVGEWQKLIATAAMIAMANARPRFVRLEGCAVSLQVTFFLERPKALKGRSERHRKRPDFDKLARAVSDGLTGVAWEDDSQVDYAVIRKQYAEPGTYPRADVVIYPSDANF